VQLHLPFQRIAKTKKRMRPLGGSNHHNTGHVPPNSQCNPRGTCQAPRAKSEQAATDTQLHERNAKRETRNAKRETRNAKRAKRGAILSRVRKVRKRQEKRGRSAISALNRDSGILNAGRLMADGCRCFFSSIYKSGLSAPLTEGTGEEHPPPPRRRPAQAGAPRRRDKSMRESTEEVMEVNPRT
jgi:hypothetical protein